MSTPRILTAYDCIDFAMRVMEGQGVSANQQSMRWALHNAYMELGQEFAWSFLHKHGRIFLHAAQDDGTATYDHTGGAYERLLTLSGATFPSWAEDASVRIDGVTCRIEDTKSTTTATLDATMNPGRDVAAGSSYRIYPSYYALPNDFKRLATPRAESVGWELTEMSYDDIMALDRDNDETGTPVYYCIRGVEDLYGQMGLFIHPDSDDEKTLDFIYERMPREIRYTGWEAADYAGTISVTAASPNVTGAGSTGWSSLMQGAIMRIGTSASNAPTGLRGTAAWVEERAIATVSTTSLILLDNDIETSRSGVKCRITDPIDIDPSLHQAMLWGVARHLAIERNYDGVARIEAQYAKAVSDARRANNRTVGRQWAGVGGTGFRRLADVTPILADS